MTFTFDVLDLEHDGERVENRFQLQERDRGHLALILPGAGYTTLGPMLYYASSVLADAGADILSVDYASAVAGFDTPLQRADAAGRIAFEALNAALERRRYNRLTIIGKSMGTRAMARLARASSQWLYHPDRIESVWLTPILTESSVVEQIPRLGTHQFLATGTWDVKFYSAPALDSLPPSVEKLVIEGGNHSLDIEDSTSASLRALNRLVDRLIQFVGRP